MEELLESKVPDENGTGNSPEFQALRRDVGIRVFCFAAVQFGFFSTYFVSPVFSPQCNHLQSISPAETKRITILRPSKMVNINNFAGKGNINEKQMKKVACVGQLNGLEKCHSGSSPSANWNIDQHPTQ
ncbi:Uncharacterized protein Adt_37167 [Abeliophyllum distichum]|uniref:Uncharacterized protein n=1 Tax=Abeliophyllum distichum TaxID=126358 RepID=A0ABD1QK40_9LAMI